ncbi:MAG: hypothetical protein LBJ74_05235 [Heliobacteriaceae bacterium]|jgi:hypothetical protein|nr:hypothetical protein [Heliobacteriaceae bacterium]
MKYFLTLIFLLAALPAFCAPQSVVVVPVDIMELNAGVNPDVSEIFAQDITGCFNSSKKITSPGIQSLPEKLNANQALKNETYAALRRYKTSGTVDYPAFKKLANTFGTDYVLLVSGYVSKRSFWEVFEVSRLFNICTPFELETNVVLLDTASSSMMWRESYKKKMVFRPDAQSQLDNIRLYSRELLSQDAAQNITLRFFPKTVRALPVRTDDTEAPSVLKFDKPKPKRDFVPEGYGEMLYSI